MGKAKAGEAAWRNAGDAAARGRSAESDFARDAYAGQAAEEATQIREQVRGLEERIQAVSASVEQLDGRIQEGARIAGEAGGERLQGLNARLQGAAEAEKELLVAERLKLVSEKEALEERLGAL